MKAITEAVVKSTVQSGGDYLGCVTIVTPLQEEHYDGTAIEAWSNRSGSIDVGVRRPVRFVTVEQAELFRQELVELICRHTGGSVK